MNILTKICGKKSALVRVLGISTSVVSALQIHLFMQNEPNFPDALMNVNKVLTKDYEKRTLGKRGKNEPKTNPNEPNLSLRSLWQSRIKPKRTQFKRGYLLINRFNRICCVYGLTVSFVSAKMALYTNNWNLKNVGRKKLNLLKRKRLYGQNHLRPNNWHNFCILKSLEFSIY